jgi:hypothetical protein
MSALAIETFSNVTGGNAAYKALSHPATADAGRAVAARLAASGPVALYDPAGLATGFAALFDLSAVKFCGAFVQDIAKIGRPLLGMKAQPVTDLSASGARCVFVAAFDAERTCQHIAHLVPKDVALVTLDQMRLDARMLSKPASYLDPLNFATNFVFFRDAGADGGKLAEWRDPLGVTEAAILIDSRAVRARFGLPEFTGQLFVHRVGATGHDVFKYALDTYDDSGAEISCTHDANAWPADYYAGLPAPAAGERVKLWLQNSHPRPIPPRAVGLAEMGSDDVKWLEREIAPFATVELDAAELLPGVTWPRQIEVTAGRHFVRPRYEVAEASGRRRIAHVNVERTDLKPDPAIAELANLMGKGFILPAPVLPPERFRSIVLATPMARSQAHLPVAAALIDATGREVARHSFGDLPRGHRVALDADALGGLPSGYGHVELTYDFSAGTEADGWLHALFRYEDKTSGGAAETSFGAHVFNTVLTWKGEPQSYSGRPPGLTTRLFLRLGPAPLDTMCHLIYPASTPWRAMSDTTLTLHGANGEALAEHRVEIPCGGSLLWRASQTFAADALRRAGDGAYVVIRDTTCRLFGYHGLLSDRPGASFSLDHMFGY